MIDHRPPMISSTVIFILLELVHYLLGIHAHSDTLVSHSISIRGYNAKNLEHEFITGWHPMIDPKRCPYVASHFRIPIHRREDGMVFGSQCEDDRIGLDRIGSDRIGSDRIAE